MHTIQALRGIPVHLQSGLHELAGVMTDLASRIWAAAKSIFMYCTQGVKPWYDHNIKPLTSNDYLLLTIGFVFSSVLLYISLKKYGVAALPLALCAGGIILGGCGVFSRTRLNQHFNDKAWEQVDLMRRAANTLSSTNQDCTTLVKERAILDDPEYEHLKEDLKKLDEETRRLRSDLAAPSAELKQKIVKSHLDLLIPNVAAHAQDKALLDAMQQEIAKVGTDKQDIVAIESHKQKLKDLQSPQAVAERDELIVQVNELVKVAQGPDFNKTKAAYLEYLVGVQQKLSKSKDVKAI